MVGSKNRWERTPEEKKMDRVLANRRSARESRERRKNLVANLAALAESLTEANAILSHENRKLREEASKLLAIYMRERLEQQQALPGAALRPTMSHFTTTIGGILDPNLRKTSSQIVVQPVLLQNPMRALHQDSLVQLPLTQTPIQPGFSFSPRIDILGGFNSVRMAAASTQRARANTNANDLSPLLSWHLM